MIHNRGDKIRMWLFNPFVYIAGARSLLLGLILITICAWLGFLNNAHFDGVLDMHRAMPSPFSIFLVELIIDWVSISIVLLGLGIILSKSKIRWIDVLGTQALARWPMIPAAILMVFIPDLKDLDLSNIQSLNRLVLPALIMLVFIIWFVALMFNAYKVSCNLKGTKLIVSFIGGLISAEIISKFLILKIVFGLMIQPGLASATDRATEIPSLNCELTDQDLKKYLGVYSSPSFPLKVTITNKGNNLIGQATGQPSFQLKCFEQHKFKFDQAGLKLEFAPEENKMILLQSGGRFELKREP